MRVRFDDISTTHFRYGAPAQRSNSVVVSVCFDLRNSPCLQILLRRQTQVGIRGWSCAANCTSGCHETDGTIRWWLWDNLLHGNGGSGADPAGCQRTCDTSIHPNQRIRSRSPLVEPPQAIHQISLPRPMARQSVLNSGMHRK